MTARQRKIPFLILAPAVVLIVGLAAGVALAALGTVRLKAQSDDAASLRSKLLSLTLAERLRRTDGDDRSVVLERAARRSGAELLLVTTDGQIVVDGTQGAPTKDRILDLLAAGEGETTTELGRSRFFSATLESQAEHMNVIAFVEAPETPFATPSLIVWVGTLTALLVGVAVLVALALARDVHSDVTFVRNRIVEMAREGADPAGKPIPVRSVDLVGLLTSAFNVLVDRFSAAEHAYRQDLSGALAYDRDRSDFLAALSHELRTPLNAILGFTDVLLSEVDGALSEDAKENLSVVRSSGQHLRALIDDILDLSALESGELRLNCKMIDVLSIGQEVIREARIAAEAKQLAISVVGNRAMAYADGRRVRQIIGNIVGNAVKFTSQGSVSLRIDPRDGGVTIAVSDTGPGIAREDHEAIFQEYWQAGDVKRQRIGTGLGLAITRRLVQMHRGFIDLTSQLGKGSTFTIVLPSRPPVVIPTPIEPPPRQTIDSGDFGSLT
ncbi:MAG TPA: HAMP domain-containing sensor histidine kinase [Polyangiaceae bacterium]|nr:HAMP domain-containing sensor histidine kinase [Polyangiaceae bacterium]